MTKTADITSTNVYHYLFLSNPRYLRDVEFFLNQFESVDELDDFSYHNPFIKGFFVSRILRFSDKTGLKKKFIPTEKPLKEMLDVELACLILTYKNYQMTTPEVWKLNLKERQQPDGSWSKKDTFCHGGIYEWSCPALNTALALNALH